MHKDTRELGHGRVQITIADERWYAIPRADPLTGLPEYDYLPSVTWIAGHYPKGIAFFKWLASKGWDEAAAIRAAAADKGSRIHQAIADLLRGEPVEMGRTYATAEQPTPQALSLEEYEAVLSFAAWWWEPPTKTTLLMDTVVVGDGYAGTLDWLGTMGAETWLIDFKTGAHVWPEHHLQVSAYRETFPEPRPRVAVLQLGYPLNARRWKLTEVEPCYDLFQAARAIWAHETDGQAPARLELPLRVALAEPPVVPAGQKGAARRGRRTSGA